MTLPRYTPFPYVLDLKVLGAVVYFPIWNVRRPLETFLFARAFFAKTDVTTVT